MYVKYLGQTPGTFTIVGTDGSTETVTGNPGIASYVPDPIGINLLVQNPTTWAESFTGGPAQPASETTLVPLPVTPGVFKLGSDGDLAGPGGTPISSTAGVSSVGSATSPSVTAATPSGQPQYQWTFDTTGTTDTLGAFNSGFYFNGAGGVSQTCWFFGYNVPGSPGEITGGGTGSQKGYFSVLPDCGDTHAVEIETNFLAPDGTTCFPFQFAGDITGAAQSTMAFELPQRGGSWNMDYNASPSPVTVFSVTANPGGTHTMSFGNTATNAAHATFYGDVLLQTTAQFRFNNIGQFTLQATNTSTLLLTDIINSKNIVTFTGGANPVSNRNVLFNSVLQTFGALVCGGTGALATSATDGFLYWPTSAGQPTGTPTSFSGTIASEYDTTDNVIWFRGSGGWRQPHFYRNAQAGNYAPTVSDRIVACTGTGTVAQTITLPGSATAFAGFLLIIKDEAGGAGTHNITINRSGSDTIDGATSVAISTNYGAVRLYCTGSGWAVI